MEEKYLQAGMEAHADLLWNLHFVDNFTRCHSGRRRQKVRLISDISILKRIYILILTTYPS